MSAEDAAAPVMAGDLSGIVGRHLIYAYDNGWKYELYVRNPYTVAFRCLQGPMFGRWSTEQPVKMIQLGGDQYKIAWVEPTGTVTVLIAWLGGRSVHTTICYPQWMLDFPESTLGRYQDNLDQIIAERDRGPTYPQALVASTGRITYLAIRDLDDDTVIDCPPAKLPLGYADRTN
ncbi:phenolic acid decarboxylase [Nocardia yunnanensis]|uniref:Phenolic acid decarboxylase n=1 Tax=Nocardia yunnanensis TaxID=2382165 RepID=A0A386ZJJ9_9NOCA|nr:phenolic acid decarboxylase [Nocardia yunnanensis]AYF77757.1 phenolic acid decarboxylase [Nocardia yunnanensis]